MGTAAVEVEMPNLETVAAAGLEAVEGTVVEKKEEEEKEEGKGDSEAERLSGIFPFKTHAHWGMGEFPIMGLQAVV